MGDRRADAHLRRRVLVAGGQSGTVSSVNSLRGACLVQGILVTRLAATTWPAALITEAHPKALLRLDADAKHFVSINVPPNFQEHERDAALAAYSAWAAVTGRAGWSDLVLSEVEPFFPVDNAVTYWLPGSA